MQLDSTELLLADLFLKKSPPNTPFKTYFFYDSLLQGQSELYAEDSFRQMCAIHAKSYSKIRSYLLEEDFLECVSSAIPKDRLSQKGEHAKRLGGIQQYKDWEQSEIRKKRYEDFPKKHWAWYDIGKILAGIAIGSLITYMCTIGKYTAPPTAPAPPPADTAQPPPRTLNTKDTASKPA